MKNNKPQSLSESAQAIQKVLQAERDAERAIQDCEIAARQIIREAHKTAQRMSRKQADDIIVRNRLCTGAHTITLRCACQCEPVAEIA